MFVNVEVLKIFKLLKVDDDVGLFVSMVPNIGTMLGNMECIKVCFRTGVEGAKSDSLNNKCELLLCVVK